MFLFVPLGVKKRKKRMVSEKYKNKLKEGLEYLNNSGFINSVNKGIIGSYVKKVDIPLGYISYHTRSEGLKKGFKCLPYEILNSIYNREPFLNDDKTFVSKTSYLIRYMYGVADFGILPVSLVSNGITKSNSGIVMNDCLLGKDRGHFMTVFKYMVTEGVEKDEDFWKKVVNKLKSETSDGNETPLSLVNFQNSELMDKLYELKESGVDKYSLESLISSEIFNRVFEVEETVSIRLETISTHKTEIRKINNGENTWKSHNHGLTELTDCLISRPEWGYNQNKVDEICSESSVMRGENVLLRGRKDSSFSGYLTEPLMLFVSSLEMEWTQNLYKFLGGIGKDYDSYVEYIGDKKVTTKTMTTWLNRIERVSGLEGNDGYNIWVRLDDVITSHYDTWKKQNGKENNNFNKLRPTSMDTGLFYIRGIHHFMKDMGYSRGREGTYDTLCVKFVEYMIDLIENNTHKYETWMDKTSASWQSRFKVVFNKVFDDFVQRVKSGQGKIESEKVLKKRKLLELRMTKKLPYQFEMYDRKRTGEWEIVKVNLETGDGLQLCHYVSETNGGQRTDENTFIGPGLDNNVVGGDNCPKDYLMVEMSQKGKSKSGQFFETFTSDVDYPKNPYLRGVYSNTMNFCLMSTEINKK